MGEMSDKWQPIETAPKDREILATDGCYRTSIEWYKFDDFWALTCPGDNCADSSFEPTHWMELPDLPK
jgi:hypothetical protein